MAEYSKILTEADVFTQLEVPSSWLKDLFPPFPADQYDQRLVVEDEIGENWDFVLCIRQGQHKKPYISQATWHPFVVDKHAEVGDKVVFSSETDGATGPAGGYKIRVMKKVMLFGVIIGHA